MEEIRQQLESGNVTLQRRSILKLVNIITKKKTREPLSKSPELVFLWERCTQGSSSISSLCSAALRNLVLSRDADAADFLKSYLSVLPSAKNLPALLNDIVTLCVHEILKNPGSHFDYFIEMLKCRPDSGVFLLQNFLHWLKHKKVFPKRELLSTLKYVWLNPFAEIPMNGLSSEIFAQLTEPECLHDHYEFALEVLLRLQLKTTHQLQDYSFLLQKLSKSLLKINKCVSNKMNTERLDHALILCLAAYEVGLQVGTNAVLLLDTAAELVNSLCELRNTYYSNVAYLLISYLMARAVGNCLVLLTDITESLLKREGTLLPVAYSILFPLLQLHGGIDIDEHWLKSVTVQIIHKIESLHPGAELSLPLPHSAIGIHSFSTICYEAIATVEMIQHFEMVSNLEAKIAFLSEMSEQNALSTKSGNFVLIFVTSLIYKHLGNRPLLEPLFKLVFQVLESDPSYSVGVFPFLLYCLNKEHDPDCQFDILNELSRLGKYRPCVASVLTTLHLLGTKDSLKAQAMRFMVQLWKQNQRTFPFLHKMLSSLTTVAQSKDIPQDLKFEILCSVAATVKDVCELNPTKYGSEVLASLSTLLDECKDDYTYPASSMALQAINSLCSAEVVDIRTVWKVVEPLLRKEKRPLIIKNIFELMSLIPALYVATADYDKFMEKMVEMLWNHINRSSCCSTVGAAYYALSKFNPTFHTLKMLPQAGKDSLKLPKELIFTPLDEAKNPEDVLDYVPGECYVKLLKSIDDLEVLENYGYFMSSLVEDEVKNLPRRVFSNTLKVERPAGTNNFLGQIPSFLCSKYEANKLPIMKGSLAVGVLFSFQPPVLPEKGGSSVKRHLLENNEFCERVLEALIQDVPHDISNWNLSSLLPGAWISFISVIFKCCEEGQQVVMESLPENAEGNQNIPAWVSARNSIVEVIKNGSKGKPSSHANAVLALTGLVLAIKDFNQNFSDNSGSEDCWLSLATETILSIAFPQRKSENSVFLWLLKNPYKSSQSGTALVQGSALLALSHLVSFLSYDIGLIRSLLGVMDNQMKFDTNIFQFYGSLGLGMFAVSLWKAGFVELKETDGRNTILKYAKSLEEFSFDDGDDARNGPMLGLVTVISALFQYGSNDSQSYANEVCTRLKNKLMVCDPSSTSYDLIAFSVSVTHASAACRNVIPLSEIITLTEWMINRRNCYPNCTGTAVSLGILLDTLFYLNANYEVTFYNQFVTMWMTTLLSEQQMTLSRLSALRGLMAMFSGGIGMCPFLSNKLENKFGNALNDVVRETIRFMRSSRDTGLLNPCAWSLGLLFNNWREHQTISFVSGVSTYSYLSDKSVLKVVVDYIVNQNQEENDPHIDICLKSVADRTSPLPPMNWGGVLSTVLFQQPKPNISVLALKIVLNQMKSSTTASALFTTCITVPHAKALSIECKDLLIDSLPEIACSLQSSKLELCLQNIFLDVLTVPGKTKRVLEAFSKTVTKTELSEMNRKVLQDTITGATVMLVSKSDFCKQEEGFLLALTNCIRELPDAILEGLLANAEDLNATLRCYLVKVKRKQLTWLAPCFENVPPHKTTELLRLLHTCCSSEHSAEEITAWLLGLIGRSNNFLRHNMLNELSFLVKVFMVSVASLTGQYAFEENMPLWRLCGAVHVLLDSDDFRSLTPKILEWLLSLTRCPSLGLAEEVAQCIWLLRHTKEFSDPRIWTSVL